MADALVRVRLLGLPIDVHRRAAEHQDALRREFSLLRYSASPEELPARLFALDEELSTQFSGFTERPRQDLQDALDADVESLDLSYEVPTDAAAACRRLGDLLDELDEHCAAGEHLITLTTPPEALAYRRWFLDQFIQQIAGAEPLPWSAYAAAAGVADPDASAARFPTGVQGDEAIVRIDGELDAATCPGLRDHISRLLRDGATTVVLDMTGVRFVDSVGMSVVVAAHHRCIERGGQLRLRPSPALLRTLGLMGLDQVLSIEG
jgi:anti-sigma B factor antagonist